MRRAALVLAVMAGVALAVGPAMAEHSDGPRVVQVAHGHHGHDGHHGHHGGHFHGGHHGHHGFHGYYGHGCYGPPPVVYRAPVYPRVYSYAYPGSMHYHHYSYPGNNFYYSGRNFGFSIGF